VKRTGWLGAAALLTACAPLTIKTSDVVSAGSGNYLVVAKPSDNTDWSDIQLKALAAANAWCDARGEQMQQVNVETHGAAHWGQQSYGLTFRCVAR
jgi:hypothetical protein